MRSAVALASALACPAAAVRAGADPRRATAAQTMLGGGSGALPGLGAIVPPTPDAIPCENIARTPSARCKGEPPSGWDNLGRRGSAEECAAACQVWKLEIAGCVGAKCPATCEFAVYNQETGACTSYPTCSEWKTTADEGVKKTWKVCPMSPTPAPTMSTPAPTMSTPAPTMSDAAPAEDTSMSGDPFTTHNGKRTQFYLPMGVDTPLIACGPAALSGAPVGSGIPGDHQQWFRSFAVRAAGAEVLRIEARDVDGLTDASAADGKEDVTVDLKVQKALAAAKQRPAEPLTTLNVTAAGRPVTSTGSGSAAGDIGYAVTRDMSRRLGAGFAEAVTVTAPDFVAEFSSAAARKLAAGRTAELHMHVDMRFTQLNAAACTGVLPEIWGTAPMTEGTARMLSPPQ